MTRMARSRAEELPMSDIAKALEYRRRAYDCLSLAEASTTLQAREAALKMAASWDSLAAVREAKAGIGQTS
jgi:hypothetical protein